MGKRIAALLAVSLICSSCGGAAGTGGMVPNTSQNASWGARVVQPAGTLVLTQGVPSTIFIQPAPGFVVTPPLFLTGFNTFNPFFNGCAGIVNVVNTGLVPVPFGLTTLPTVGLVVTPIISTGSCLLPINLGFGGSTVISVVVGGLAIAGPPTPMPPSPTPTPTVAPLRHP